MMHHNKTRKFSRERGPRKALLQGLVQSLIEHGKIQTTVAKAKEIRPIVEKLVTRSRIATLASRRLVRQRIGGETETKKLFDVIGPKYKDRNGGYTRIVKIGKRHGDKSPMAQIEFV